MFQYNNKLKFVLHLKNPYFKRLLCNQNKMCLKKTVFLVAVYRLNTYI